MIDDLLSDRTAISFFFCESDHSSSLQARTILGSLIRQCVTVNTLPEDIQDHLTRLFEVTDPDPDELEPLFRSVSNMLRRHYIVLDGFDECAKVDRETILKVLQRVSSSSQSSIKIFVASRDDAGIEIRKVFKSFRYQETSCQGAQADIAFYIEKILNEKIEQEELVTNDPELVADIQDALVQGAQGM